MSAAATINPLLGFGPSPGVSDEAQKVQSTRLGAHAGARLNNAAFKAFAWELLRVVAECGADEETVPHALNLVLGLSQDIAWPEVAADPDGELALDWATDDYMLSVSVGPKGRLTYAGDVGQGSFSGTAFPRSGRALPADLVQAVSIFGVEDPGDHLRAA